jgi:accessory gene regulator B
VNNNWFMKKTKYIINKHYSHLLKKELEKIYYGLEGLYRTIPKLIIILLLSFLIGSFKEIILLILLFNVLRHFAFGVHAPSSYICFIISIIIFIGASIIIPLLVINKLIRLLIGLGGVIIFIMFAPADTRKRPLINIKKRRHFKLLSVSLAIIYTLLALIIKDNLITNTFLFALIIESILILPLTYKLFNEPYRNYSNF